MKYFLSLEEAAPEVYEEQGLIEISKETFDSLVRPSTQHRARGFYKDANEEPFKVYEL